jgi:hypothetical protein
LKIKISKTIILPVVLYGWETRYLIKREECRLRVFEELILRQILGPKTDENWEWGSFHIVFIVFTVDLIKPGD